MAKLGTPTKDENGRLIQRWYPEVGDIRPEGLEFLYFGSWYASREIGQPVTQDHCDQATYRIPSAYIPPSGWYCVDDEETVMDGDRYHIDDRQGDIGNGHYGCIVSKFRDAFGGWVLRREPSPSQAFLDRAGAAEERGCVTAGKMAATPSDDEDEPDEPTVCAGCHKEECQCSTAPVAWQFPKRPMERVVDHYRLLNTDEPREYGDLDYSVDNSGGRNGLDRFQARAVRGVVD